jgi:phosphohistidine phosphatase
MKTLYIVRHGKAMLRATDQGGDFDRQLIEKGIRRTTKLVEHLNKIGENVELIISSPAIRAIETAKIIASGLHYPIAKLLIEKGLYTESESHIFDLLSQTSNDISKLMVVGHNPTLTNFLNYFLEIPIDWLKMSSVACLHFDTDDWTEITKVDVRLAYLYPNK